MKHISKIWPVIKDLSDDLGLRYTTVHSWFARNRLPANYDLDLIKAAEKRGHSLTLEQIAEDRASARLPKPPAPGGDSSQEDAA